MDDVQPKSNRALPIAVAAGIAVGVFGILLVANGGKGKSSSGPTGSTLASTDPTPSDKPTTTADKPADKPADTPTTPSDKPADKPVVAAATPDAAPTAPKTVTLTITVKPADAKVTVDGKPVTGGKIDLPMSDTPVKIAASATGYEADEKTASASKDGTVSFDLKKEVAVAPKDTTKNPPPKNTTTTTPPPHPKTTKHPKVEL